MGAWGYKALESDEGLDVLGFLQDLINQHNESKQLLLRDSIQAMKNQGFFGETFEDIDFFYDMSAMALAEFYIHYLDTGQFYGNDSNGANIHMTADKSSLTFILRYLKDIRDDVPDQNGSRELVELWSESQSWPEWQANLANLIERMEQEISHLASMEKRE